MMHFIGRGDYRLQRFDRREIRYILSDACLFSSIDRVEDNTK